MPPAKTVKTAKNRQKRTVTFSPNLTPAQIFKLGSFGGAYWRDVYSSVLKKQLSNQHHKFPFLSDISESLLVNNNREYGNSKINRYKVRASSSLKEWEKSGWITKHDPYGWVQWYCNYYNGRRIENEDKRQIDRWMKTAGPRSRFRLMLINELKRRGKPFNDFKVYPRIRQTLQHWGVRLTPAMLLHGG